MNLYAIFRRNGWDPSEVEAADARSNAELDKLGGTVRKIRSYVLEEPSGRIGTICMYEADSPEAVMDHAKAADLPCEEIVRVVAIDVKNPDPEFTPA